MTAEDGRRIGLPRQDGIIKKDTVDFKPRILEEILYQQENIARFPLLEDLPVKCGFSWGKESGNMQELIEPANPLNARGRTYAFLHRMDMSLPPRAICFSPVIKDAPEILEITPDVVSDYESSVRSDPDEPLQEMQIGANLMYTRLNDVTLMVKPGDCAVAVLYASTQSSPILGVAHWGRDQLDKGLAEDAIGHLKEQGCDPKEIKIAISPGLSPEYHYIQEADLRKHIRNLWKWTGNFRFEEFEGERRYHLDLLGYLLDQLRDSGVSGSNIEAYGVDTYKAAERGESFSYRYSVATGQPHRNGRIIIAAQLK